MTAQTDWRQSRALAWFTVGSQTLKALILLRTGDKCTVQVFVTNKEFVNAPVTRSYVTTVAASKLKKRVE